MKMYGNAIKTRKNEKIKGLKKNEKKKLKAKYKNFLDLIQLY